MVTFTLDPRIEADSIALTDLPLCAVRLMRDAAYPWLLLVPRRAEVSEIVDLEPAARMQLIAEIARASDALRATVACDKLNVAAIGNLISQLHVHIIARRRDDPAWPNPVWGQAPPQPYAPGAAEALIAALAARLEAAES